MIRRGSCIGQQPLQLRSKQITICCCIRQPAGQLAQWRAARSRSEAVLKARATPARQQRLGACDRCSVNCPAGRSPRVVCQVRPYAELLPRVRRSLDSRRHRMAASGMPFSMVCWRSPLDRSPKGRAARQTGRKTGCSMKQSGERKRGRAPNWRRPSILNRSQ